MPVNVINGTDQNDTLDGQPGSNQIHGAGGNDDINGWVRDDSLYGDAGNDTLFGFFGDDLLSGGEGNDVLTTSERDMGYVCTLFGGEGDDSLFAVERHSHSFGGAGNDVVTIYFDLGGEAHGGRGTDVLVMNYVGSILGSLGENAPVSVTLTGPDAHATAYLQSMEIDGFEILHITTSDGNDTIIGGALDDRISVFAGANVVDAGEGNDEVSVRTGSANVLQGGLGDDVLVVVHEVPEHCDLAFTVTGDTATDNFGSTYSGFETYRIWSGGADDTVCTGAGDDLVRSFGGDDILDGAGGSDRLLGGEGNDVLMGGAGRDHLTGSLGQDDLTGGGGGDTFDFGRVDRAGDVVRDFETGVDRIQIAGRSLGPGFTPGPLDPARLVIQDATGEAAQFIWRAGVAPGSHDLVFDSNGTLAGGELLVATFLGGATLQAADILIL